MRLRGALALGMLLCLVASNVEAVTGDIRDGAEHHESMAEALVHHLREGPGHIHLAEWDAARNQGAPVSLPPDDGHQAPGGHDHCSHLHGVGIPAGFSLEFAVSVTEASTEAPEPPLGVRPPTLPHPPKA